MGAYTQQFVAFPLFDAPQGMIVTAIYPDALVGGCGTPNADRSQHTKEKG